MIWWSKVEMKSYGSAQGSNSERKAVQGRKACLRDMRALLRLGVFGGVMLAVLTLGSLPAWAQAAAVTPPPEGMSFTTQLEHTAVWVGDQFRYQIRVEHTDNYEFVMENLNRDNINMDPLQVIAVDWYTDSLKDGNTRLFLNVTLVSFATGQDSEQIPQITLFYFRRDRPAVGADEAAAESLTVPGPIVGLRTTLPPEASDIRDDMAVTSWPGTRWLLGYAGWISLMLLLAGTGWESWNYMQSRKIRKGPDRRKAMESIRMRWARGVPSEFSDPQVVADFYDSSYQNLKEYLTFYLETPAEGLTADELQEEMQRLGTDATFSKKVVTVLGACEQVRYAQNGAAPSGKAVQSTAQDMREILNYDAGQ